MQSKKLQIGLLGYGKMGKTIDDLTEGYNAEVVWRIDSSNRQELTSEKLREVEVVIEFSHPDIGFQNIIDCLQAGVPVVSGTTGWLDRFEDAAAFCKKSNGTMLYASNFSIGVNLFFELNRKLAELMKPWPMYQAELSETHHTHKKDAPSGTAISLAKGIIEAHPNYSDWHLQSSEAVKKSLPITAHRKDEVPGTHEVLWRSAIDEIRIEHVAHSREGFASGALLAAHWVVGKKGVFSMRDVLGV